jgi:phage FluMu protein Com
MKPDCRERQRAQSAGEGHARESRCACGSLLARLTAEGVELKCRRCKRLVIVRWSDKEHRALAERSRYPP